MYRERKYGPTRVSELQTNVQQRTHGEMLENTEMTVFQSSLITFLYVVQPRKLISVVASFILLDIRRLNTPSHCWLSFTTLLQQDRQRCRVEQERRTEHSAPRIPSCSILDCLPVRAKLSPMFVPWCVIAHGDTSGDLTPPVSRVPARFNSSHKRTEA